MNDEEGIKEVREMTETIHDLEHKRRRKWLNLPYAYRWSHGYNGKSSVLGVAAFVGFVMIMVLAVIQISGGFGAHHLQNGVSYECPGGDWHGNTSQMISMTDTYNGHINYYCPVDGQLIGYRGANEPIPIKG